MNKKVKQCTITFGAVLSLISVNLFAQTDSKTIIVASESTTPGWMSLNEHGKLEGYDHDVWQEIGKRTGYKIEYKTSNWDGLWPMLDQDRIDTVAEQVSITDERKARYNFSIPYAYNLYVLISAKDNSKLNSMKDLKSGMTISSETNSSDERIVKAVNQQYGIELKPMYYDGMSVQDVALGRCDLWPRAKTSAILTVKNVNNLRILGDTNVVEINAYPFSKSKRGKMLSMLVSNTLQSMKDDGTLTKLSKKWFNIDVSKEIK